ncbi:hypothetical protein Tco_1281559 [Tanacetum coccineum]
MEGTRNNQSILCLTFAKAATTPRGEDVSDPDSLAPKPAKATKKPNPKPTQAIKTYLNDQNCIQEPKPAQRQTSDEEVHSRCPESSDGPTTLQNKAKAGKVVKKRTAKSSKQLVDEFIDEEVSAAKPRLKDTKEEILEKTPKKKSPAEQYIFQIRSHVPTEIAGHEDSTSLYVELGLSGSDTESDEECL